MGRRDKGLGTRDEGPGTKDEGPGTKDGAPSIGAFRTFFPFEAQDILSVYVELGDRSFIWASPDEARELGVKLAEVEGIKP